MRANVDVLYATGPNAMRAAMDASRTIPIVGDNLEDDAVEGGFVASLARPGGNVTGLFLNLPDLAGKWLQLLKEILPRFAGPPSCGTRRRARFSFAPSSEQRRPRRWRCVSSRFDAPPTTPSC